MIYHRFPSDKSFKPAVKSIITQQGFQNSNDLITPELISKSFLYFFQGPKIWIFLPAWAKRSYKFSLFQTNCWKLDRACHVDFVCFYPPKIQLWTLDKKFRKNQRECVKAVSYIVILEYSLYSKLSCCIRFSSKHLHWVMSEKKKVKNLG